MFIHVGRGNKCWLVMLGYEDNLSMSKWKILESFPTVDEAITFAYKLAELPVKVESTSERR